MGFTDSVKDNPVWWSLSLLVAGFVAGIATYSSGMSIFNLEPIQKGSYITTKAVNEGYIEKKVVESDYLPKACGRMKNYPTGSWLQVSSEIAKNKPVEGTTPNVIGTTKIYLSDPKHGVWFEGLGVPRNGKYTETVEAPLGISPGLSAGARIELEMTHVDFSDKKYEKYKKLVTKADLSFDSTATLNVSEDGCTMSGKFSSVPLTGFVVYCWEEAKLHGLCPDVLASAVQSK